MRIRATLGECAQSSVGGSKSTPRERRLDIGKRLDAFFIGETYHSVEQAHAVVEEWRTRDGIVRPQLKLGYRPPAPQALCPFATRLDYVSMLQ